MSSTTINAWQGGAAFIGITVGAIPLIQFLVRGRAGSVWNWLLDSTAGPPGWAGPLVVLLATGILIAVLEHRKRYAA